MFVGGKRLRKTLWRAYSTEMQKKVNFLTLMLTSPVEAQSETLAEEGFRQTDVNYAYMQPMNSNKHQVIFSFVR